MVKLLPKDIWGKLSILFLILGPVLFLIGGSLADTIYDGVASGDSMIGDIVARPYLAITMLSGILSGILTFIFSCISVIWKKEGSILVFISLIFGTLFVLFLIGEILFPH